jgi:hypothetical protein
MVDYYGPSTQMEGPYSLSASTYTPDEIYITDHLNLYTPDP